MQPRQSALYNLLALPIVLVLLGGACAQPAPSSSPTIIEPRPVPAQTQAGASEPKEKPATRGISRADWEALVKAAEQEGKVVIYGAPGQEWRNFLTASFSKEYPQIKVEYTGLGGTQAGARIVSEQAAGVFAADLFIGGVTTANYTLIPNGALQPISEALLLPEVLDTSLWWQGKHWYSDEAGKYHFMFAPTVSTPIAYQTKLINPDEIQSFKDLLNPKWKGKIVSWDPRQPGASSQALRFFYHHPDLGKEFIRQFYSQTGVVVSADGRQIADWIAHGRYPLGAWVSTTEVDAARSQGLPVDTIRRPLREGAWISTSYGGVGLLKNAPHINAAKVYINWLLSKSGQAAMQEVVGVNSARTDVPKDALTAEGVVPLPGFNYIFIDLPRYVLDQKAEEEIRYMTRELLEGR